MPIEFLDLLAPDPDGPDDDAGWAPFSPDAGSASATWSEGGSLADAPVDVAATFRDTVWVSTKIDPTFGLTGVRLGGGLAVPRHRHNSDLLVLVFGGALVLRFTEVDSDAADEEEAQVGSGQFCIIGAGTAYSLTASGDGATFLTSWPQDAPELETTWYPDPAWVDTTDEEDR